MRTLLKTQRGKEKILLEATRKEKEFQLIQVTTEKIWLAKWTYHHQSRTRKTESISYEFKWRNIGSTRWGRTEILSDLNKNVSHLGAFKIFFKALDYSESMTFKELPIFLEAEGA